MPRRIPISSLSLATGALAAVLSVVAPLAAGQAYPTRPIKLIIPFAPGGSSEIVARTVAAKMSEGLGQQMIVESKPGGAGNIAMQEVAHAAPDGYTLIIGHIGSLAVNPFMFKNLPYDVNKDFTPISLLVKIPTIYVVNSGVPANNLKELAALTRQREVFYGSAGNASAGHLAIEYLKLAMKVPLSHVPYKGTGPMLQDLLGARTDMSAAGVPPLIQHVKNGKLRAIATGSAQRIAAMPDLPTVAEQGYAGFETSQWYGMIGPANMPEAIVKRLAEEAAKAVHSKDVQEKFAADSAVVVGDTPQEFAAFIKQEQDRWQGIIKAAGLKAD